LSVALPADCERLDSAVAHPPIRENDDAERVILAYVAALEIANATIGASRECKAQLRARYAAYGKGAK
jgi:hypothetical protein